MRSSSDEDLKERERRIVSLFEDLKRSPELQSKAKRLSQIEEELRRITMNTDRVSMTPGRSIDTIFLCQSLDEIHQLRAHYDSGLLQDVLRKVFTLLADISEHIDIKVCEWETGMYKRSVHLFEGRYLLS